LFDTIRAASGRFRREILRNDRFACARAGDPRAVRLVLQSLEPRLRRMAAYYAQLCHEDADDLLQEARLGLLEALREVDVRIGRPEQYLIQCARWRLLDALKRARSRRALPLEPLTEEMLSEEGSVQETVMAEVCVGAFTRTLPPTQQAVLKCLMGGSTWRETGDMLGCTSANVAYHVRQIQRRYVSQTI